MPWHRWQHPGTPDQRCLVAALSGGKSARALGRRHSAGYPWPPGHVPRLAGVGAQVRRPGPGPLQREAKEPPGVPALRADLLCGTRLEDDLPDLLWSFVNLSTALRCLLEGLRWLWGAEAVKVAGRSGISQARTRLGAAPLHRLYEQGVRPIATHATKGAWYRQWRLVSLDGSCLDVADTQENRASFGSPGASRGESAFPQLRFVEGIACAVAPLMTIVSRVSAPVVSLLDASTKAIFRLFGVRTEPDAPVTEQDIKTLVAEAETAGVIETDERKMISGVLRLGDRAVRGVMTPRTAVDWIDLNDPEDEIRLALTLTRHTRLPVAQGDPDNMLGVVQSRELLAALLKSEPLDLRRRVRRAPVIPDTVNALDVLNTLRQSEVPIALVHDEYGHFEGIVTPAVAHPGDGLISASRTARTMPLDTPLILYCGTPDGVSGINCTTS